MLALLDFFFSLIKRSLSYGNCFVILFYKDRSRTAAENNTILNNDSIIISDPQTNSESEINMTTSRRGGGLGPLLPQDLQDELKNRLKKNTTSASSKSPEDNDKCRTSSSINVSDESATSAMSTMEHSDAMNLVRNLSHLTEVGRGGTLLNDTITVSSSESESSGRHDISHIVNDSPSMRKSKMGEG